MAEAKLKDEPDNPDLLSDLAIYATLLGREKDGRRLIEQALTFRKDDPFLMLKAAEILNKIGDVDVALDLLIKARDGGVPDEYIRVLPALEELVAHPRYSERPIDREKKIP
ncbi:hypothetical protein ACFLU6_13980 [Acidobacteriota bacterium]